MGLHGYYSLGWCMAWGIDRLQAWCLGPGCNHWTWLRVDELRARGLDDDTTLLLLARRMRCSICRRRGCCFIRPAAPPPIGTPDRRDWVLAELMRLRSRTAALEIEARQWGSSEPSPPMGATTTDGSSPTPVGANHPCPPRRSPPNSVPFVGGDGAND